MSRLKLWILGTALGSFAAGMNVGLVAPSLFAAEDPRTVSDDRGYVRQIAADYDLSNDQEASLRLVLQKWREEEITAFRTAEIQTLPAAIRSELRAARARLEQRIRAILDGAQRDRYDRATKPQDPSNK